MRLSEQNRVTMNIPPLLRLTIILLFAAASIQCTKENSLYTPTEEKIRGEWKYEQVVYTESGLHVGGENITYRYQNLRIDFQNDKVALLQDLETAEQWEGNWRLIEQVSYDANLEGQVEERIEATLFNSQNGGVQQIVLDHLNVTREKIRASEYREGATFRYTLVRP